MSAPKPSTSSQISELISLSGTQAIDTLLIGTKWGMGVDHSVATIYYSFPTSGISSLWSQDTYGSFGAENKTLVPFNATQQSAAVAALNAWASVANINFINVVESTAAVGDIRIGFTSGGTMDNSTYAYAYVPQISNTGVALPASGDLWINTHLTVPNAHDFTQGAAGFETILHELGHTLGLAHSFDKDGAGPDTGLPAQFESYQYSVMSYSDTAYTYDNGAAGYYPTTPMLYDIQAIQYLYGANMSYHAGNDTYIFNGTSKYYQTIWDAGGIDTIKYVSNTGGVINLIAGDFSTLGSPFELDTNHAYYAAPYYQHENVAIAFNVTIENAIGGGGSDVIFGNGANNQLSGGAGNDTLSGALGDDTLDGGTQVDYLYGDLGNDTFIIDLQLNGNHVELQDIYYEYVNEGIDTISLRGVFTNTVLSTISLNNLIGGQVENLNASATGTTRLDLVGNDLNNQLTGNSVNNSISGGIGDDTLDGALGIDTLIGGVGNDTYVIDTIGNAITGLGGDIITELVGEGDNDTVITKFSANLTSAQFANIENIILLGPTALNATGNAGTNKLTGNAAANILDGGAGVDAMDGGKGDDVYIVSEAGDTVTELYTFAQGGGIDLVRSAAVSFTLATNVDNLILTVGGLDGTGNELNNIIVGNASDNILDGRAGNDSMYGGAGNDTYVVDSTLDTVTEGLSNALNGGNDTVKSSLNNYVLGLNVDNLILTDGSLDGGVGSINGIGNILNNNLTGNAGNNSLSGYEGNDVLIGGAGNDTLNGGLGVDSLQGGNGDDVYYIDNIADVIDETGSDASDKVIYSVNASVVIASALILGAVNTDAVNLVTGIKASLDLRNIEQIILTGTGKYDVTGSIANNGITGNTSANSIAGGDGNDTLDGGLGLDTLNGGNGDDIYYVDSLAEANLIQENVGEGVDTVNIGFSYTLASNLENLTLTGISAINGTGNASDNTLIGNSLANILKGLEGSDVLLGGAGNDTLDGGTGVDTMVGGFGSDTYIVDSEYDRVVENGGVGTGIDTIKTTLTNYSLAGINTIENLSYAGSDSSIFTGTGNALNNIITGGKGNDILTGLGGVDTLIGGMGDDTYYVNIVPTGVGISMNVVLEDMIAELAASGTDAVILQGSISTLINTTTLTLAASLEYLDASQTSGTKLNLTGNDADNQLIGNDANNILFGLLGKDTLIGGAGNDTLDGGLGADSMQGGVGDDVYVIDNISDVIDETGLDSNDKVKYAVNASAVVLSILNLGETNIVNLSTTTSTTLNLTNIEHLILIGLGKYDVIGNSANNAITGNATANSIIGGDGNDTLDGGLGLDILNGGNGDDVYYVDSIAEANLIQESSGIGSGIDALNVGFTYSLLSLTNLENLTLVGASAINGTGNNSDNTIVGNSAANVLSGLDGNDILSGGFGDDTLFGGLGNDTLLGGAGSDSMYGGAGDDVYVVDFGDILTEGLNGGVDRVESLITRTLGLNFENLTLLGLANINGIGNAIANTIIGNNGNNSLSGGGGDDTLIGGFGNDILDGGMGNDYLVGGSGNDSYYVDSVSDVIIENTNEGIDSVTANVSGYILASNIENLTLSPLTFNSTATGNNLDNNLTGNLFDNTLYGLAGNDTFNGGFGNDTLYGGTGDDVYYVGKYDANVVIENVNEGIDTIYADWWGSSYVIQNNVENLYINSTNFKFSVTGNESDNTIISSGLSVSYTMSGLGGNDTLIGYVQNDNLFGDDGNDAISGGGGGDFISGGSGLDTLTGGAGNDYFYFETTPIAGNQDVITDFSSYSINTTLFDTIDFLATSFSALSTGYSHFLNYANFVSASAAGAVAQDTNDFIIYNTDTGSLYYDADGNGAGSQVLVATFANHANLIASDIFIYQA